MDGGLRHAGDLRPWDLEPGDGAAGSRMIDGAEHKRRQSQLGTKISAKGFGRDRRLSITNRFSAG